MAPADTASAASDRRSSSPAYAPRVRARSNRAGATGPEAEKVSQSVQSSSGDPSMYGTDRAHTNSRTRELAPAMSTPPATAHFTAIQRRGETD